MVKFKVGDIIRGNERSNGFYTITNSKMKKGKVIEIDEDGIFRVKIMEHDYKEYIGEEFINLEMKYFEKVHEDNFTIVKRIIKNKETCNLYFENGKLVKQEMINILDDEEKEYLSQVIRPFRSKVLTVEKISILSKACICINISGLESNEFIDLPYFRKDTMYKNMKDNRKYTLEELGL